MRHLLIACGGGANNSSTNYASTSYSSPTWSSGVTIGGGGTGALYAVRPDVSGLGYWVPDSTNNGLALDNNMTLTVGPAYTNWGNPYVLENEQNRINDPTASYGHNDYRYASFGVMGHNVYVTPSTQYYNYQLTAPYLDYASDGNAVQNKSPVLTSDIVQIKGKLNFYNNTIEAISVTKLNSLPNKFQGTIIANFVNTTRSIWYDTLGSSNLTKGMLVQYEIDSYMPTQRTADPITCTPNECTGFSTQPYSISEAAISLELKAPRTITKLTRISNVNAGLNAYLNGYVNNIANINQFAVQGIIVDGSQAQISSGTISDIKAFAHVNITGRTLAGGVFLADRITINTKAPKTTLGEADSYVYPPTLRGL
jgi:hypothetical protein